MVVPTGGRAERAILAALLIAALYFGREVVMPLAIAMLLAFALMPTVIRLTRLGLPRLFATCVTMLAFAGVVTLLGMLLLGQVRELLLSLPQYRQRISAKLTDLEHAWADMFGRASDVVNDLGGAATPPVVVTTDDGSWGAVASHAGPLVGVISTTALVLMFAFVMLLGWEDLRDRFLRLAGNRALPVTTNALSEAATKITRYLQRQLLLNAAYGSSVGVFLWIVGVPNALVWAILAGVLRFVPYIGPVVGILAPVVVAFATSDGWTHTVVTGTGLLALESLTNLVLEPWLYGRSTGITPLALLVAAAFWTWLWGLIGLVMSTPMTVCLFVAGKHFPGLRFFKLLVGDAPALPMHARLYHRMLADAQGEAWEIVTKDVASRPALEIADELLLPAAAMANTAFRDGDISAEQHERIGLLTCELVDELYEAVGASAPPAPGGAPLGRVLCIPARDSYDEAISRALAKELERRGFTAEALSKEQLVSETMALLRDEAEVVACVTSMIPTHFVHVRSLLKRLRSAHPHAHFVLNLWGEDVASSSIAARLPRDCEITATVRASLQLAEQCWSRLRAETGTPSGPKRTTASSKR